MTLKYIWRSFSLGCHFHVHFSYPWHAFASHGLPAIAELLVFQTVLEFLVQILHAYYTFLSMLDYTIFIQLSATLTKLRHIKRDHHMFKMSTIDRNARWVVALNIIIWHKVKSKDLPEPHGPSGAALISVSIALSQTPAYAARPRIPIRHNFITILLEITE